LGGRIPKVFLDNCKQDSDCISVKAGCCGCANGGTNTAINKKSVDIWNSQIPKGCICLTVYRCNARDSPKCLSGNCELETLNFQGKSKEFCEELEGKEKDYCFFDIVQEVNDLNICENINDEMLRLNCYSDFGKVFILNSDINSCKKINSENIQNNCITSIALDSNDLGLCYEHDAEAMITDCIIKIALKNSDYLMCEVIENQSSKATCIIKIAKKTDNSELCREISENQIGCFNSFLKDTDSRYICASGKYQLECLNLLLSNFDNPIFVCNSLANISFTNNVQIHDRSRCVSHAIKDYEDASICKSFDFPGHEAVCYQNLAVQTKNPEICEQITPLLEFEQKQIKDFGYMHISRDFCYTNYRVVTSY